MSVNSFHQQMNRGADTEVTLMSDFNMIYSLVSSRVLFSITYLLFIIVARPQPHDVDHVGTWFAALSSRFLFNRIKPTATNPEPRASFTSAISETEREIIEANERIVCTWVSVYSLV